jgi:hypothetical protein
MRGTRSEVSLLAEVRLEAGKESCQAWLINTLSRRMRVGEALQVASSPVVGEALQGGRGCTPPVVVASSGPSYHTAPLQYRPSVN